MWKPAAVVPEHRRRAWVMWVGLLLSIIAYTMYQINEYFHGRENPTISLEITNGLYEFPFVTLCFFESEGCDDDTEYCAAVAQNYSTVWDWDYEERYVVHELEDYPHCVGYGLNELKVTADPDVESPDDARVIVDVQWIISDTASIDDSFVDYVQIFTSEAEPTGEKDVSVVNVPFTRYEEQDEEEVEQSMALLTIGKTTQQHLSGAETTIFSALLLSEFHVTIPNEYADSLTSSDYAIGRLYLEITQGKYSKTVIKEKSPLDLLTTFGNIGGFWELLILFWGLFFIANRKEPQPKLKARNFVKAIRVGKRVVTRRMGLSVDSSVAASPVEERPDWEAAYRGGNAYPTTSTSSRGGDTRTSRTTTVVRHPLALSTASNSHHLHQNGDSPCSRGNGESARSYRRPIAYELPRRDSRSCSGPPAGQPAGQGPDHLEPC